jgi:hypothetical protein
MTAHSCIKDDGGTPGRRCSACEEEAAADSLKRLPDCTVPQPEAIERLLGMIRLRLETALRNGQRVSCHAREGLRTLSEKDGSFTFSMHIERK